MKDQIGERPREGAHGPISVTKVVQTTANGSSD